MGLVIVAFPVLCFTFPESIAPDWIVELLRPKYPENTGEICYAIQESIINEPERWTQYDGYHFTRDDDLTLWIANGKSHMAVHLPEKVTFSPKERARLWQAYINHKDAKQEHRVSTVAGKLGLTSSPSEDEPTA